MDDHSYATYVKIFIGATFAHFNDFEVSLKKLQIQTGCTFVKTSSRSATKFNEEQRKKKRHRFLDESKGPYHSVVYMCNRKQCAAGLTIKQDARQPHLGLMVSRLNLVHTHTSSGHTSSAEHSFMSSLQVTTPKIILESESSEIITDLKSAQLLDLLPSEFAKEENQLKKSNQSLSSLQVTTPKKISESESSEVISDLKSVQTWEIIWDPTEYNAKEENQVKESQPQTDRCNKKEIVNSAVFSHFDEFETSLKKFQDKTGYYFHKRNSRTVSNFNICQRKEMEENQHNSKKKKLSLLDDNRGPYHFVIYSCVVKNCPAGLKVKQDVKRNIGLEVSNVNLDHNHSSNVGSILKNQKETPAAEAIPEGISTSRFSEIPDAVKKSLGDDFLLQSFEAFNGDNYICKFRLPCETLEDLKDWKKRFEETDRSDFSMSKHEKRKSGNTRINFHCHHGGKSKVTPSESSYGYSRKNFGCEAKITCNIHKPSTEKLSVYQQYPTVVELRNIHCHDKVRSDVYKYRKPTDATKQKVKDLIQMGYKASTIIQIMTLDLEKVLGHEELKLRRFDHSLLPTRQYIYRMHRAFHERKWGDHSDSKLIKAAQEIADVENKAMFIGSAIDTDQDDDQDQDDEEGLVNFKAATDMICKRFHLMSAANQKKFSRRFLKQAKMACATESSFQKAFSQFGSQNQSKPEKVPLPRTTRLNP